MLDIGHKAWYNGVGVTRRKSKGGNYSSNTPKGELFVFTLNTYWNAVMHSNKCDYYYNPQGDTKDFHFHLTVASDYAMTSSYLVYF